MFAPALARCSRLANKQTCDFGLPKSGFFRHFLPRSKKWHKKPAYRARVAGEAVEEVA
jgi:hypothetical protein